jgi:hypothetical protein
MEYIEKEELKTTRILLVLIGWIILCWFSSSMPCSSDRLESFFALIGASIVTCEWLVFAYVFLGGEIYETKMYEVKSKPKYTKGIISIKE